MISPDLVMIYRSCTTERHDRCLGPNVSHSRYFLFRIVRFISPPPPTSLSAVLILGRSKASSAALSSFKVMPSGWGGGEASRSFRSSEPLGSALGAWSAGAARSQCLW